MVIDSRSLLEQGIARAQQEAVQVIAGGDARLDLPRRAARFEHANEDRKEVGHALAQLLDVGMLVGRTFVAVDRQALVDASALQVELACRATP